MRTVLSGYVAIFCGRTNNQKRPPQPRTTKRPKQPPQPRTTKTPKHAHQAEALTGERTSTKKHAPKSKTTNKPQLKPTKTPKSKLTDKPKPLISEPIDLPLCPTDSRLADIGNQIGLTCRQEKVNVNSKTESETDFFHEKTTEIPKLPNCPNNSEDSNSEVPCQNKISNSYSYNDRFSYFKFLNLGKKNIDWNII